MASGCASHPTKLSYDDIRDVRPNCMAARSQIEYLNSQIRAYQDAHQGIETEEDRKYIAKAKNVIWSLRSTCPANSI